MNTTTTTTMSTSTVGPAPRITSVRPCFSCGDMTVFWESYPPKILCDACQEWIFKDGIDPVPAKSPTEEGDA